MARTFNVAERSLSHIDLERPTEGFADAAPNEANDVGTIDSVPMRTRLAYNGRRAEGPCGKTILGDTAADME